MYTDTTTQALRYACVNHAKLPACVNFAESVVNGTLTLKRARGAGTFSCKT